MSIAPVFCAVLLAVGTVQEPRVSARLSGTSAGIGESIVYEVNVEGAGRDVDIGTPRFPEGLVLQGTQDFTEMHISFPGGRSQTRRREFALQAVMPGRFRIPPVSVTIGDKTYRTNAVEIVVTGTAQPQSMESSEDAWLHATMNPDTVYTGQQSTLTVEAGFSEDVRVRLTRAPAFELPSPTGFWVQDVPGGVQSQLRAVNGRITEIQTMQRAYFPLSAGRYAFAPARAVIDVREGFLFAPETREIRSSSPRLTVLPLPERGKPQDFSGAVGTYTIRASVSPDTVTAGEAAQITIEVSGRGNIKALPQPALPTIAGVEQFAPTEEASVSFDGAIVEGRKQFRWVVIPDRAGRITIPAVSYSFFDPRARSYQRITSAPRTLIVRPAAHMAANDADATTALRGLREKPEHASLGWVRSRGFLLAQLIPLLAIVAALAMALRRRRAANVPTYLEDLARLRGRESSYPEFLRDVEGIVRSAAARRAKDAALRTARLAELIDRLRNAGVSESTCEAMRTLIERIESQRFAPAAAEAAEREAMLTRAEAIVRDLMNSGPAASGPRRAPAVFALVALLQVPGPAFDHGIELYRAGHFSDAARAFENVIARDSNDIAAWTNLGNAYYRAGERGRATWAWARAAKHAPRDAALIRNLRAAGAVEVLRTRPPLSVRPVEWYFLAALAWWVGAAIAVVAIVRRRKTLLAWTLPACAVVVIALAIGAVADGRAYGVALNEQTPLYGDPTVHSPVVRRVQPGAGLDILERRGDWLRVRTITQAEGWVESDAVGLLR